MQVHNYGIDIQGRMQRKRETLSAPRVVTVAPRVCASTNLPPQRREGRARIVPQPSGVSAQRSESGGFHHVAVLSAWDNLWYHATYSTVFFMALNAHHVDCGNQ